MRVTQRGTLGREIQKKTVVGYIVSVTSTACTMGQGALLAATRFANTVGGMSARCAPYPNREHVRGDLWNYVRLVVSSTASVVRNAGKARFVLIVSSFTSAIEVNGD